MHVTNFACKIRFCTLQKFGNVFFLFHDDNTLINDRKFSCLESPNRSSEKACTLDSIPQFQLSVKYFFQRNFV
jgi:hypothetical protein